MSYRQILERNRRWVEQTTARDAGYFRRLAADHAPRALYIGCSDARVPVDVVTQTAPGELFVHRNVANLVVPTDTNLLAVLQYAVEVLRVEDVIVCGHEGCGGVRAAMSRGRAPALVDNWLANIRTVARLHDDELSSIADPDRRYTRLVELNVTEQIYNLGRTAVVQSAWASGATLRLHGWVYRLEAGLLRDLHVTLDGAAAEPKAKAAATPATTDDLGDARVA
ncbi:MAG: carbonic anhydrase [Gemmatirosa sp.]|nr:carbonic anhydrase [Gemmatirosa sp.]